MAKGIIMPHVSDQKKFYEDLQRQLLEHLGVENVQQHFSEEFLRRLHDRMQQENIVDVNVAFKLIKEEDKELDEGLEWWQK